jgi:hypothetical protein
MYTPLEFNVAQDVDLCQCEDKKNPTDPMPVGIRERRRIDKEVMFSC